MFMIICRRTRLNLSQSFSASQNVSRKCSARRQYAQATSCSTPWRPSVALDEWVSREARPISLRQLTFFGRTMNEQRLLNSANYVRTELPARLAHRLRDMQTLPYIVLSNKHLSHAYELYYKAFEMFRKVPEVRSLPENTEFCHSVRRTLQEHQTVIPRLIMGVLEVQKYIDPTVLDDFVTTLLRSRISRRVIAEQHIALTDAFHSSSNISSARSDESRDDPEHVGEIFLRCNAKEVVELCAEVSRKLLVARYGESCPIPAVRIRGDLDATFPYIISHLQYIIGEVLRNSMQASIAKQKPDSTTTEPIDIMICETTQHVILRFSDQGGGIPPDILSHLWSFSKGPRRDTRLQNLNQVPRLSATMQELDASAYTQRDSSLSPLTGRSPDLKLGIGLPMSKIYAEYWAGSLDLHSLEGYGVDVFLQISKLGNKNEHITTRASMDAL